MVNNELKPNYSSYSDEEEEASGSEDEPTSGSDSESDPNIKPIRSVPPMEQKEPTPDTKPGQESKPGSLTAPASSKRPAAGSPANEKDAKKPSNAGNANNTTTDDDSKKQLFQRLWSEEDEIVILKGMIDYKNESGENIISDMGAFYEFIKNGLHVDVSRAQLVDKIRRLRKKYVNNVGKEKNGKDRSFSKSHEQKGYELSKLIWGSGSGSGSGNKKSQNNGTGTGTGASLVKCNGMGDKEKNMDISRFVRYGGRDEGPVLVEEIVKGGMELAEGGKRVELEERWRSLKKEEIEIYLRRMELVKEQALVVLEAVNASGN